ncbi:hypothetical protein [Desulfobacter vibrioformis]|uniref:hypothetical protein n=1 Tax=Desulfobacter vibrioformis TaxID=34031 RepID=UPI000558DF91|nr:hypothetical protein [Desulfobacter vibrioformis]
MYFLLSGEGPTDLGVCPNGLAICEGEQHSQGPLAIIMSQIAEQQIMYSFIDTHSYGFISKGELKQKASELKKKKSLRLPGKKKQKETEYYYRNARSLALFAKEKQEELNDDDVIAVLFRDSDGSASADRGHWQHKRDSMIKGFQDENFEKGVPMVPKPKSEAWIICAVKNNPYQGCGSLENRSGNDNSPQSLKKEIAEILKGQTSRTQLCELVNNGTIDWNRIEMPSFLAFKNALIDVL